MESLAFFVGPALAGFLLAVADVAAVFAVNALTFVLSAVLVCGIRPTPTAAPGAGHIGGRRRSSSDAEAIEPAVKEKKPNFLLDAFEGFRVIWRHPDLRLVVPTYCAQTVVAGASFVFTVAIAFDMTDLGASGLGWLDSVLGVGAIFGGFLAIGLASRHRLASDFGWGVVFWALPLLLIAVWPTAWAAFIAMAIIGAANPVVDINASTILQRLTPDAVMGRVFGALESGLIATMALGALVMPLLIAGPGLRWGVRHPLGADRGDRAARHAAAAQARPQRVRARGRRPARRSCRCSRRWPGRCSESLAGKLTRIEVPAGTEVVRVGETGDRFYVIESGRSTRPTRAASCRRWVPGSASARSPCCTTSPARPRSQLRRTACLQALDREDFLAAMSGDSELLGRAESLAARRIPTV